MTADNIGWAQREIVARPLLHRNTRVMMMRLMLKHGWMMHVMMMRVTKYPRLMMSVGEMVNHLLLVNESTTGTTVATTTVRCSASVVGCRTEAELLAITGP